jgi:predicted GH43/DUF377 family glycosyl hydrolase
MKKFFIGCGLLVFIFLALHAVPRDEFKNMSLESTIRLTSGENLTANDILADPTVLVATSSGVVGCAFPARWETLSSSTATSGRQFDMWFTTYTDSALTISTARSADGQVFHSVEEAVLRPGPGWDSIGVETANVIVDPQGQYRMYYGSSLKEHDDFAIGLATSLDGVSWVKRDEPVFLPTLAWEFGEHNGVLEPSVLYDTAAEKYKLWYSALGEKNGVLSSRIGYAISDDGITWERHQEPVLDLGSDGAWDDTLISHVNVVKNPGGGYHLFYFGVGEWDDAAAMQKGAIGHAYSKDGIQWEKNPANPVIKPETGTWRGWTVGGPSAAIIDGELHVWFFGNPTNSTYAGRIGVVKGVCS